MPNRSDLPPDLIVPVQSAELSHHVVGGVLLWVSHASLRIILSDSPVSTFSNEDLDAWVLRTFSLISEAHTLRNPIHKPVETSGEPIEVFRPTGYGRTIIIEAAGHLFEVKGAGVARGAIPSDLPYKSGLMPAMNAVTEMYSQALISRIFNRHKRFQTVECLAVIVLPIELFNPAYRGKGVRQALLVRPHYPRRQHVAKFTIPGRQECDHNCEIELLIRRYGLTTCNPAKRLALGHNRNEKDAKIGKTVAPQQLTKTLQNFCSSNHIPTPATFEVINVQCAYPNLDAGDPRMIDFEHVRFENTFRSHLVQILEAPNANIIEVIPLDSGKFSIKPKRREDAAELLGVYNYENTMQETFVGNTVRAKALGLFLLLLFWSEASLAHICAEIKELEKIAQGKVGTLKSLVKGPINDMRAIGGYRYRA